MAQKEQKVSEPAKLTNEPAKSKPSASQPMLRPPMLVRTPRPQVFHQQQQRPLRQPSQPPFRPPLPIRHQPQPPRLQQQQPTWHQQVAQGHPSQWIPKGAFYVPRLTPKPRITKPIWAVNNKTTHFCYDASFVAFAQTFKAEDFDKLAINALSAITPDIESDHKRTCYDFVSTIGLWYKTVDYLRHISPKMPQQQIQLGYLTHTDQTDLLAQFMLDHVKRCDHCMYICMAHLNKRATEPVFSIAQNHSVPLTDISGRIHPNPVEQFYQLKLQEQQQAHHISCCNNNSCHTLHQMHKALRSLRIIRFPLLYNHNTYSNTKLCNNNTFRSCNKWLNTISRISICSLRKSICNLLYRFPNQFFPKTAMEPHHTFHHNQLLLNNSNNSSILFLTRILLKPSGAQTKRSVAF